MGLAIVGTVNRDGELKRATMGPEPARVCVQGGCRAILDGIKIS